MGLVGYNDRDRKNNESMNDTFSSMTGISYLKKEKIKEVTKDRAVNFIAEGWFPKTILPNGAMEEFNNKIDSLILFFSKMERDISHIAYDPKDSRRKRNYSIIEEECEKLYKYLETIFQFSGFRTVSNVEQICAFYTSGVLNDRKSKKNIRENIKHYCLCHVDAMKALTEEEKSIWFQYSKFEEDVKQLKSDMVKKEEKLLSMKEFATQLKTTMDIDSDELNSNIITVSMEMKGIEQDIVEKMTFLERHQAIFYEIEYLLEYGKRKKQIQR